MVEFGVRCGICKEFYPSENGNISSALPKAKECEKQGIEEEKIKPGLVLGVAGYSGAGIIFISSREKGHRRIYDLQHCHLVDSKTQKDSYSLLYHQEAFFGKIINRKDLGVLSKEDFERFSKDEIRKDLEKLFPGIKLYREHPRFSQ